MERQAGDHGDLHHTRRYSRATTKVGRQEKPALLLVLRILYVVRAARRGGVGRVGRPRRCGTPSGSAAGRNPLQTARNCAN